MFRDTVRNEQLNGYDVNILQQHQVDESLSFQQNNRDYEASRTTPETDGIINDTSTSIVKLTVPKLKLRVPKEFQKSVDAILSTSESDEGSDEVSSETISSGRNFNEENLPILLSPSTDTNFLRDQNEINHEICTNNLRLNNGEMITENSEEYMKKSHEEQLKEITMNKQQHEHQPPGEGKEDISAIGLVTNCKF